VKDSNLRSFRDGFTDHQPQTRDQRQCLSPHKLPGVFQADSRRQPTSAVANRTRHLLPSRRLVTGLTGLLVRNHVLAQQSFIPEIVGTDLVANAVSLNSSMVNAARAVGPALAGVLIVSLGVGACFLFNTVSFVALIIALATMKPELLRPTGVQVLVKPS
jgi:hypothetical protein